MVKNYTELYLLKFYPTYSSKKDLAWRSQSCQILMEHTMQICPRYRIYNIYF